MAADISGAAVTKIAMPSPPVSMHLCILNVCAETVSTPRPLYERKNKFVKERVRIFSDPVENGRSDQESSVHLISNCVMMIVINT